MSVNWSAKRNSALRMLTKFGQTVILKVNTVGAYDADLMKATTTSVNENRKAAIFDFDRINFGQSFNGETLIQSGDRRCIMDANGTKPKVADNIIVQGEEFPIADIKILSPAGVDILYDMLIRK